MITDKYFQEISREQLLSDLKQTKTALEDAYSNFEQVVDPDLVDSYIYEVNAVQKRYHFLLKQVQMLDLQEALENELAILWPFCSDLPAQKNLRHSSEQRRFLLFID